MLFQSVFACISDLIVLLLTHFFLLNKQYIVTITDIILNIQKKHFNNFQFIQTKTATTCIFSVKLVVFVLFFLCSTPKQYNILIFTKIKDDSHRLSVHFLFTFQRGFIYRVSAIPAGRYNSLRPSTAFSRVTSSAYSRSPPTGIP